MSASRERSANTSQSDSEDEEPLTKAKLFALADNGHWAEMGVGVAWVAEQPATPPTTTADGATDEHDDGGGPYMTLNISSLDEKGVVDMNDLLMSTTVMPDEEYKVQRHSILLWSDPRLDGKDMAISFHSRAGCDSIVDSISKYQQKMRDAAAASRSAASSSPTSATAERAEDEGPTTQGGGDSAGGLKRSASNAGSQSNNTAARQNTANQTQTTNNNNSVARQRQLANSNSSMWAVEKQNLQFLAESSMSSRHRFGCEVRDRRSFVYDICNLFVVAVHEGDVQTIDLICNIVVNCLTFFSAEVHVITQFVEEKTVEAVIDVVQFYLGRRTKESGFESRNERQQAFRNPAKFPPWLVSRVHYFYAIQYLRDLIPHKLEAAADGDQSLVNLFLLRARLNMVHELFRRPAPTCPDGQQEVSASPARATASTDVIHEDGSEDDSTTQINPPQRNASLAEPVDPDRSLLEQGMLNARTMEERRGVAALIHDITYNIKFNSAYGLEVRNDVFSNLVKCDALEFLSNLLRDELAETALNGDDTPAPSTTSTPHHTTNHNPSSSRASSHRRAGSSKRPSHQPSITSSQSVRFIADIISHIAVWAPGVVCGWLLEDAKKPILMPASQLRALAPPPPMLARASTLIDPPGSTTSTFATPPRSPVAPTAGGAGGGSSSDLSTAANTNSSATTVIAATSSSGAIADGSDGRDRTVSVHDYDGDASMEPASPLDVGMHQHLQSSSSVGSTTATPTSLVAPPNDTTATSNEEDEEVMSPTVHHPPTPSTAEEGGNTNEDGTPIMRNIDGVSPSPMSSSSSREPGNTPKVLSSTTSTNATTPTTAAAATTASPGTGAMGVSSPRTAMSFQPKPFGRSLLFLLVEALGIVSNSVALQALVDALVACGIGLVQNSTAPSIFGAESAALRVRVLQYWVTGCCTPSGLSPLPAMYVPLYHALRAASFDVTAASSSIQQHEKAENRSLQALRLLRILGREKALIASVPFFNAVKDSGVVASIKQYFDSCRLAGGASRATSTAVSSSAPPFLVLPSAIKEQIGHKRERSPSEKPVVCKEEEGSGEAARSLSSTLVAPLSTSTSTTNLTTTTTSANAGNSAPQQQHPVIVSKQLLSAMCAFLGVLISFNTEEVDTYIVESGVLSSMVDFRKTLRPGGSMVSAGILSVFAATPAAFREGKERPGGLSSMASAAIADITRSPYVNTIENSNQNQGASLTGVMSSGSSVLLAYVYGAFEEYLIKEAPTLLRTIARALEGKQDDDVCSSVSNVSSFYAGAGGSANQEAFEAELAVLKSEGHFLQDDPPIPGVLGGGLGGGSDEDSFGKLSVDDAITGATAEEDDDEEDNAVRTRSSSTNRSDGSVSSSSSSSPQREDTNQDNNINNVSVDAQPQPIQDDGSNTVGVISSPQKAEEEEDEKTVDNTNTTTTNTTAALLLPIDSEGEEEGRYSIGSSICGDSVSSSATNSTSIPVATTTTTTAAASSATAASENTAPSSEVVAASEATPSSLTSSPAVSAASPEDAKSPIPASKPPQQSESPKKGSPSAASSDPPSSPATTASSSPTKGVLGSPPKQQSPPSSE